MTNYIVVDCDSPIPSSRRTQIDVQRLQNKLDKNIPDPSSINILVGVTKGEAVNRCALCIRRVIGRINQGAKRTVINNYVILNSDTLSVEAGLKEPRDLQGELLFLTDRPATRAIFKLRHCWWNAHHNLLRGIDKHQRHRL